MRSWFEPSWWSSVLLPRPQRGHPDLTHLKPYSWLFSSIRTRVCIFESAFRQIFEETPSPPLFKVDLLWKFFGCIYHHGARRILCGFRCSVARCNSNIPCYEKKGVGNFCIYMYESWACSHYNLVPSWRVLIVVINSIFVFRDRQEPTLNSSERRRPRTVHHS